MLLLGSALAIGLLARDPKLEIFGTVIGAVAILVVNGLVALEVSAELLL